MTTYFDRFGIHSYTGKSSTRYSYAYSESVVASTIGQPIPISRGYRMVKGQLIFSTSVLQETRAVTTNYAHQRTLYQWITNNADNFWGNTTLDKLPEDTTDIETTGLFVDCAIGFGQALNPEITAKIVELRAGNTVLYTAVGGATAALKSMGFTLYTGTETQLPDPLLESYQGVGNMPAYRGEIYAVFKRLDLMAFGGVLPDIYAVIADVGSTSYAAREIVPAAANVNTDLAAFDPAKNTAYWVAGGGTQLYSIDTRRGQISGVIGVQGGVGGLQSNICIAEWAGLLIGTDPNPFNVEPIYSWDLETGRKLGTFGFEAPASTSSTHERFATSRFMISQIAYGGEGNPPVTFVITSSIFNDLGCLTVTPNGTIEYCGHKTSGPACFHGCRGPVYKQGSFVYLADDDSKIYEVTFSKEHKLRKPNGDGDLDFPTTPSGAYSGTPWKDLEAGDIQALHYFGADDSLLAFVKDIATFDKVYKIDRATRETIWVKQIDNAGANISKIRHLSVLGFGFITWTASGQVYSIDAVTGEYSGALSVFDAVEGVNNDSDYFFDFTTGKFFAHSATDKVIESKGAGSFGARIELATLITELGVFVGLTEDQITVDARITDLVDGLLLEGSVDFFDFIRAIGEAFGFTVTESGDGIKCAKDTITTGEEAPALTLDATALATRDRSDFPVNNNDPFSNAGVITTRKPDTDVVEAIKITYTDADYDFTVNTVQQFRNRLPNVIRRRGRDVTIDISPIIMRTADADTLAANLLFQALSSRMRYDFRLKPLAARLEPGDVVQLPAADHTITCKLQSITYHADFSLTCEASQFLNSNFGLVSPGQPPIVPPRPGIEDNASQFIPIDMPELFKQDRIEANRISLFYAIGGLGQDGWREASILRSPDGSLYNLVTKVQRPTVWGKVITPLDTDTSPFIFDEVSTLEFYLQSGDPRLLQTANNEDWLAGHPAAIVGTAGTWELISIREFSYDEDTGRVTCSGFIRGLNDTYMNTSLRASGEFIIFPFLEGGIKRIIEPIEFQDDTLYYKGVGTNEPTALIRAYPIQLKAEAQRPLTVMGVHITAEIDDDLVFTWHPQDPANNGLSDGPDIDYKSFPDDYKIEILDGPGGAIVRTQNVVDAQTWTYSAANQTADGFTPGAVNRLSFYITHVSDVFGDGRTFERSRYVE